MTVLVMLLNLVKLLTSKRFWVAAGAIVVIRFLLTLTENPAVLITLIVTVAVVAVVWMICDTVRPTQKG